ncbi:MAG: hypothetical protein IH623_07215 [Verrucomicrobia bacterium]|nr:hypothetical protein [Verrucomicrobiota bacterium]
MNLYFQFLTQNPTAEAIKLIEIPALFSQNKPLGGRVKVSSEGVISGSKFLRIEALTVAKSEQRFNQLEVIFDVEALQFPMTEGVLALNGVFSPSPKNELWLPCRDWSMAVDGTAGNRWTMAKIKETSHPRPSVFELVATVETSHSEDRVLDACAEWLSSALPKSYSKVGLFGCCDAGGVDLVVRIESDVLMAQRIRIMANTWPSYYPELGARLEALHPLMFGSKRLCAKMSKALGKHARVLPGNQVRDFSVVRLDERCDISSATTNATKAGALIKIGPPNALH